MPDKDGNITLNKRVSSWQRNRIHGRLNWGIKYLAEGTKGAIMLVNLGVAIGAGNSSKEYVFSSNTDFFVLEPGKDGGGPRTKEIIGKIVLTNDGLRVQLKGSDRCIYETPDLTFKTSGGKDIHLTVHGFRISKINGKALEFESTDAALAYLQEMNRELPTQRTKPEPK